MGGEEDNEGSRKPDGRGLGVELPPCTVRIETKVVVSVFPIKHMLKTHANLTYGSSHVAVCKIKAGPWYQSPASGVCNQITLLSRT